MIYKGLVIRLIAGEYLVYDLNSKEIINAKPRGVMRIKSSAPKVGDYVDYTLTDDEKGVIERIHERRNDLIRPYISNIDQAFVIFSVKEPDLNLNLLDKFLVTLEYNNIKPIIVFNKWDLLNNKEIIRNKLKINASISNSKIFKKILNEYGSFYTYLKTFAGDNIIYETDKTTNDISDAISKDLKKRGMKFVGSTIIYSYLQAIGFIYSHEKQCYLHKM